MKYKVDVRVLISELKMRNVERTGMNLHSPDPGQAPRTLPDETGNPSKTPDLDMKQVDQGRKSGNLTSFATKSRPLYPFVIALRLSVHTLMHSGLSYL